LEGLIFYRLHALCETLLSEQGVFMTNMVDVVSRNVYNAGTALRRLLSKPLKVTRTRIEAYCHQTLRPEEAKLSPFLA
jgi:hypothetical protein